MRLLTLVIVAVNIQFGSYTEVQELQCVLQSGDAEDPLMGIELLTCLTDDVNFNRIGSFELELIKAGSMAVNPVTNVFAVISAMSQQTLSQQTLHVLDTETGAEVQTVDVSRFGFLDNLEFDLKTQKMYGQYWDGEKEHFVEVDYERNTTRSIAAINLRYKLSGTRAIDYIAGRFYLVADNQQLVGLSLETGEEVTRNTLSRSIGNGGIFFDGATQKLRALCRAFDDSFDFALCIVDPSTGEVSATSDDAERIPYIVFSGNAYDSANQVYFFEEPAGLVAFNANTGKRIAGPFTSANTASLTVVPRCECCVVADRDNSSNTVADLANGSNTGRQLQHSSGRFAVCNENSIVSGTSRPEPQKLGVLAVLATLAQLVAAQEDAPPATSEAKTRRPIISTDILHGTAELFYDVYDSVHSKFLKAHIDKP
ncbi:unnamed protein product [Symbiodinium microadriaticum]|nr:unnamed protein product [Symbiodinium sp. KB8]CAE7815449.1 unnamed protein product [Symbiodinium microadriaticum]